MKEYILDTINQNKDLLENVNDTIWDYAETKFNEHKSSDLLCSVLKDNDFKIKKGVAGMDTAFIASFGQGSPVIAILGEYDALDGLSQKADSTVRSAVQEGGNGHGCGHHSLAAGSVGAAIIVKNYLKQQNIKGTVRYYGCPAEEGGSGKVYMAREGLFNDVDSVFTWHPGPINFVTCGSTYSNIQVYFKFHGISSHAAVSPHLGRSALDAVELMNIGANFLREHIDTDIRLHYAITDTGGKAPNIVQAYSEVVYLIRAPKPDLLKDVYERIVNIAKGAALMTGTQVDIVFDKACSNIIPNSILSKILDEKMHELGAPDFNENDTAYASKMREAISEKEKMNIIYMIKALMGKNFNDSLAEKPLSDFILPFMTIDKPSPASTDVGDVSWIVPTAQFTTACYALGTTEHSWQLVSQGKSDIFHKGMERAAGIIAMAAIELFLNTSIIDAAKEELKTRIGSQKYICPIPDDVMPKASR